MTILPLLLCAGLGHVVDGSTMGTTYRVQLSAAEVALDAASLRQEVAAVLQAVDRQMSTYVADSDVVRFNLQQTTEWFEVAAPTECVVRAARDLGRLTGGALDITVAPLVARWGFGANAERGAGVPTNAELEAIRARVGLHHLECRANPPALRKRRADVAIDLSSIAKGFAIDQVAERLEQLGATDFLIEVGGELRGRGSRGDGAPWRVAIEDPGAPGQPSACVVVLDDCAIATSGDYRSAHRVNGTRYSHVIDPRTGAPIAHATAAVTVVDRSALRADALATAILVMGQDHGLAFARREQLAVRLLVRDGASFRALSTDAFTRHVLPREALR